MLFRSVSQSRYANLSSSVSVGGTVSFGNSTVNASANSTQLIIANSTATSTLNPISLTVGTTVVNTSVVAVGATTVNNTVVSTTTVLATTVNAATFSVGTNLTANSSLVNASAINVTGRVNTATFFATTTANVGANVQLSTSELRIGNSVVNSVVNSSALIFNTNTNVTITKSAGNSTNLNYLTLRNAGSNAASNSFWQGYHFTGPEPFSNSVGSTVNPRTSHYYSYTSNTNPSDLYYNIVADGQGLDIGIKIYSDAASAAPSGIDIAANGNIGIGNTSPNAKLAITGTANVSGNVVIGGGLTSANLTTTTNTTTHGTAFYIVSTGNVGIGIVTGKQIGRAHV